MKHLVLDTNVWLDWLVFDDPAIAPLRAAAVAGVIRIATSHACEAELARVLGYPLSGRALNATQQGAALAAYRAMVQPPAGAPSHATIELPRCADPDDQKFLELARDCGADALITKDQALLVLGRRKIKPLPFRILTPQAFTRSAAHDKSIG